MIRVCLSGYKAYGYNVTGWEDVPPSVDHYGNLLCEDLITRVDEGDTLMYFDSDDSAMEWCSIHEIDYELVEPEKEEE